MLAVCKQSETVDQWIRAGLMHSDEERRSWAIQHVGIEKLVRFADEIVQIINSDDQCRWWAVTAAGQLEIDNCLYALLKLADSFDNNPIPFALIQALSRYESPLAAPHLLRVFNSDREGRDRIAAAWGLARQNQQEAISYLVHKLDELDEDGPTLEARRAAQALSDVFGWRLECIPEAPRQAKQRWLSHLKSGKNA